MNAQLGLGLDAPRPKSRKWIPSTEEGRLCHEAHEKGTPADRRVAGILRGGVIHEGRFWFFGPGPQSVAADGTEVVAP